MTIDTTQVGEKKVDEQAAEQADEKRAAEKKAAKAKAKAKAKKAKAKAEPVVEDTGWRAALSGKRFSVWMVAAGVVIAALLATSIVFWWRDHSFRAQQHDVEQAETVAGKYAVGAATIDYQSLDPWIARMKKGVSADLAKKYDAIAPTMPQILGPLRLQATGNLVTAKVVDNKSGIYRVVAVVAVNATNVQIPKGSTTNAVYSVTLDRNKDWLITSVGDPTGGDQPIPGAQPTPG